MCIELELGPGMRDPVGAIMTRPVVSLRPEQSAEEAIGFFLGQQGLSGAPVVNARGELVGFVSETDVLESRATHRRLIEIMSRNIARVFQDCSVEEVVDLICARRIEQIPVIDRDRVLVGMVTCKEVIRHLFGRGEGDNR
jgi:IMP dehydrogenase